jgi:hypothetical protein
VTRDPIDLAVGALGVSGPVLSAGAPLPLEQQASIVGGYIWVERRLFEILGTWVESEPLTEAQLLFDMYSQQHGWHAELFTERLPVVDSLQADWTSRAPSVEVDRMLAELSGPVGFTSDATRAVIRGAHPSGRRPGGGTLLRLVGLGRVVLPRLVTGYTSHLRRVSPVADGPLTRSLRFVVHDEIEQWQAIETLAETLLRRPHDVAVVSSHQARLEELLAERGPGLVPWPAMDEAASVAAPPSGAATDQDGSLPPGQAPPGRTDLTARHEVVVVPAQVNEPSATSAPDRGS